MRNVFVVGSGRCGTVTFSRACEKVIGFTSAHESRVRHPRRRYPDNHIEVDPHLIWTLPDLLTEYPDAKWVILSRDRVLTVRSLARRRTIRCWGRLAHYHAGMDLEEAAGTFYDFVNFVLPRVLPNAIHLTTPVRPEGWSLFLTFIGAPAAPAALEILRTVHNASCGGPDEIQKAVK